jgi:type IV pilus assembly protein PilX
MLKPPHALHKESGAVLIVSLIFLVVLTLLGISSMNSTILETKLAANERERNWAFQVAEMGLMNSTDLLYSTSNNTVVMENINTLIAEGNYTNLTEASIDRGDKGTASSIDTEIWFKGYFPPPEGPASKASSAIKMRVVYFETATQGSSGNTSVILRNGVRQYVPKQ